MHEGQMVFSQLMGMVRASSSIGASGVTAATAVSGAFRAEINSWPWPSHS